MTMMALQAVCVLLLLLAASVDTASVEQQQYLVTKSELAALVATSFEDKDRILAELKQNRAELQKLRDYNDRLERRLQAMEAAVPGASTPAALENVPTRLLETTQTAEAEALESASLWLKGGSVAFGEGANVCSLNAKPGTFPAPAPATAVMDGALFFTDASQKEWRILVDGIDNVAAGATSNMCGAGTELRDGVCKPTTPSPSSNPTASPSAETKWNDCPGTGSYNFEIPGHGPYTVYCDNDSDGGGWKLVMKVINGQIMTGTRAVTWWPTATPDATRPGKFSDELINALAVNDEYRPS